MPTLNEEQKRAIVQGLACFRTPSEVAEQVKEEFGVEIGREHVRRYNPQQCGDVAKKWHLLFAATREAYIADTARSGIAHQAYRLDQLDDMARAAKRKGNHVLAAQLLEQAAKERGGMYTNRREVSGPGGGPVAFERIERVIIDPAE